MAAHDEQAKDSEILLTYLDSASPHFRCVDRDFDGWWFHYIATLPKGGKTIKACGIITYIVWGCVGGVQPDGLLQCGIVDDGCCVIGAHGD